MYIRMYECLFIGDATSNGDDGETVKGFSKTDANIIDLLLLFKKDWETLPKYIVDTWNMFTFHKITVITNLLYVIGYYPSYLRDLLVESTDKNGGDYDENNISYVNITDNRNLLNGKVLMDCTSPSGSMSYQFGLWVIGYVAFITNKK